MIVFTTLYILNSDFFAELYHIIAFGTGMSFSSVLNFIPLALILAYMFTLKMQYWFKDWLFPIAFAVLAFFYIYLLIKDIVYNISTYGYLIPTDILTYSSYIFAIVVYIFCFIGSIKNFKNVIFLKIGAIIKIAGSVVSTLAVYIIEFISLGGMEYFKNIDESYRTYVYNSMLQTAIKWLLSLLFFVGILLLTSNKKSEYIDITPYVQERRAKREAKRATRLETKKLEETELNAPAPEIPDGFWRCMACGKILPDSENKCDCGYKK